MSESPESPQPFLPGFDEEVGFQPRGRVILPSPESLGLAPDSSFPLAPEAVLDTANYQQRLDAYSLALSRAMEIPETPRLLSKTAAATALSKVLSPPPSAFSFSTMSYMPDPQAGGLISWPGIPPESIQRLARTTVAPELIISNRITDVLRYAQQASHPWRPGWKVQMRQASAKPSRSDLQDIRAAESFLANCNIELDATQARARDAAGYKSFRNLLATITRDFLTYDAIALWTDMDHLGRVKAWAPMPAGNIRLADPQVGYRGNKRHFAVLIDQGGTVKRPFTRDQLTWYIGHPRDDPDIGDYPYCYSGDTEVLTRNGWKIFSEIDSSVDLLATLNTESGKFEWQSPTAVIWEPYAGPMIHQHSRTLDLLLTPNHRILLQGRWSVCNNSSKSKKPTYRFRNAGEFLAKPPTNNDVIPAVSKWVGEEIMDQKFGGENCREISISGNDYCALVGAYLAEGFVPRGANNNNIYICQREYSKGYSPYRELLERVNGGKSVYYSGDRFVLCGKGLASHLAEFGMDCYSKHIPESIINATPEQIAIFLKYFAYGDGNSKTIRRTSRFTKNSDGISQSLITTSLTMANQLQELIQKVGHSASIQRREGGFKKHFHNEVRKKDGSTRIYDYESPIADSYVVRIRRSKTQSFNIKEVTYTGHIGCAVVPNGTLYIRRNGKPAWSGNSRIDAGMRIIQSFEDAFTLNADTFTKNSIPMGMLLLKGMGFTPNELDLLVRQFQNLKRGTSKAWGMPAMVVPDQSEVEFLNLSAAHGQDMLYREHMNLTVCLFCILYQFPWRRLGYHSSGSQGDSEIAMARGQTAPPVEEEDVGLIALLSHLESLFNEYILWTRWPHLQMVFTGKAPREDAREFENKSLSRTWGERRAENDLPSLEALAQGDEMKRIAGYLDMMPVDPGLVTAWGNLVTKALGLGGPGGEGGGGGAAFPASRDPAKSESHGATAGVRRHSPRRAARGGSS